MLVVADSAIPFLQGVLEPFADVRYKPGAEIRSADVRDADALLVRTRTHVDSSLLEGSRVKFVATATIGTDHLDKAYLDSKRIFWTNAPGCNAASVAQYVASALLSLSQKFAEPLSEKTLGIIGVGHVGREVLRVAKALNMDVLLCDPPRAEREGAENFVSENELLSNSDIVTLHVPFERAGKYPTYHLADETFFEKMRPDAWLLNASRGEVADGNALKSALKENRLKAAVLDVWENEPRIDPELLRLVDFGTPHIAGYSRDGKANATTQIVQAFARFFDAESLKNFRVELPSDLPVLEACEIRDGEALARKFVLETYDISRDSESLKQNLSGFENLRNGYPVRREPVAYKVRLGKGQFAFRHMLESLGFTILSD